MQAKSKFRQADSDNYRAERRFHSNPRCGLATAEPLPAPPADEPNQLSFEPIWENAR